MKPYKYNTRWEANRLREIVDKHRAQNSSQCKDPTIKMQMTILYELVQKFILVSKKMYSKPFLFKFFLATQVIKWTSEILQIVLYCYYIASSVYTYHHIHLTCRHFQIPLYLGTILRLLYHQLLTLQAYPIPKFLKNSKTIVQKKPAY